MMRDDSFDAGNSGQATHSSGASVRVLPLRPQRSSDPGEPGDPGVQGDPAELLAFDRHREARQASGEEQAYKRKILVMDKLALLEEMIRFQEERSSRGHLTLSMILKGRHLFRALEQTAETEELQLLTGSYRRHLELEYETYRTGTGSYSRARGAASALQGVETSQDD